MGCVGSKKQRSTEEYEKVLQRISEKEKKLGQLVLQQKQIASSHGDGAATIASPTHQASAQQVQDKNINNNNNTNVLPQNIFDEDPSKGGIEEEYKQAIEGRFEKFEKTLERINNDKSEKQQQIHVGANGAGGMTTSEDFPPSSKHLIQNSPMRAGLSNSPHTKGLGFQQQQQQDIPTTSPNDKVLRITEDNDDEMNSPSNIKPSSRQSIHHNQRKTSSNNNNNNNNNQDVRSSSTPHNQGGGQLSGRSNHGNNNFNKEEQEVQHWVDLLQAFDDVSIRQMQPIEENELSADQIQIEIESPPKSAKIRKNHKPIQASGIGMLSSSNNFNPYQNNSLPGGGPDLVLTIDYQNAHNANNHNNIFNGDPPGSKVIDKHQQSSDAIFNKMLANPDIKKINDAVSNAILKS